ncbi:NAD(P)-dependent oxidoreductase [Dyadobacter psychrophilus]|uniref:Putative NADH-flavin reductase n=1 Tax=Dyadobacter psychrophilus TaxID=651661 RepID=A0A1T5FU56_9BACT|nr:NAD(P)H-binding protein [Dyadobacter psychrophilus]SKB99670.1 Putative NADH-flavin reductase [Dyadobacter psychrophilus]
MNQIHKIAVLGGGGRTGLRLVNQLLDQGFQLKLLLRKPEDFKIQNPLIEIVKGDALDADVVEHLLEGCDAVISTVGQRKGEPLVASQATTNIINAVARRKNDSENFRYILLAGLNVDTPFDKKGIETQKATDWMKATFPDIHADRQKSYALLLASEVSWTMVRVPFIEFVETKGEIKINLADSPGSKISAADIAYFLIAQLTDETYVRKAPFISN